MKHPILGKYTPGGQPTQSCEFSEALTRAWPFDAYIVQYEGDRRINREHIEATPMRMVVELYDFDCPNHEPVTQHADWACSALERLPAGFQACLTANGFRVWTLRDEAFVVDSGERWEEWRAYHAGRAQALGMAIGAEPDVATDDPGRLSRLPNVKREGGKPCYPDLIGELGVATLAPLPVPVKPAATCVEGDADSMLVSRLLAAAKIEGCPWQHEHTDGAAGGTVVFPTEDGIGVFHCAHAHCAGRHTDAVIEALQGDPRVARVYEQWGGKVSPPAIISEAPTVTNGQAPSRFIRGPELAIESPPPNWLIQELEIAPGRPPVLSANAGGGKTWGLQALALAVATGQPVFGRFACRKTPVLHISRDSSIGAVKRRYQKLARGMGIDLTQTDITVFPHRLQLVDKFGAFVPRGFKEIADEAAKGYGLVILDSIASICAGLDENSVEIAQPLAATYDESCVWWWAHHNGKAGGYRGSSALMGVAGAWWTIGENYTWEAIKRSEDTEGGPIPTFATEWELDADGSARIMAVDAVQEPRSASESAQVVEARIRTDVMAFLMDPSNALGASAKRIESSVRGKGTDIRDMLKRLTAEGVLSHTGQRYIVKSDHM